MVQARNLIEGLRELTGEAGQVQVLAPYDGSAVGTAPVSGPQSAEAVLTAVSRVARDWAWSPRSDRQRLLFRVAELVKSRSDDLARLLSVEVGKPIAWSRGEVARLEVTFRLAADLLDGDGVEDVPLDSDARGGEYTCRVVREAVGPVLAIVPYNWPYNLTAHKLAPALAAGCPVVLKPSPLAPLSTFAIVDLVVDAGVPSGVVNALLCDNAVAESIALDPRIAMVSFTGSERVGWHLRSLLPEKRIVLELGGDANALVFADADLDWAVGRIATSAYGYAGQVCISAQHLRVESAVYDDVRERMIAATEATPTGDPLREETVCGPLINADAADRVMEWIAEAESNGARVLSGGNRVGNIVEPTLIEGVTRECRLATDEVFGPVLTLSRFEDEDHAFSLVNQSRFGIHASVFTRDSARIERAYRSLQVSGVVANDFPTLRFDAMPYGGLKRSGLGREGVRYAYDEYTNPKVLLERV